LKGVYFCYYKAKGTDTSKENTQKEYLEIKNVVNYDSNKMRVLGVKDGKLALIDATDNQLVVTDQGRYLPANKAYFPITATVASATANGIILLDSETYETGINNIKTDEFNEKKRGVYTLSGIKASENNNLENLPKGIYIINGKKIVK
jgi:formylmethanofuran dehydrogenase subunit D